MGSPYTSGAANVHGHRVHQQRGDRARRPATRPSRSVASRGTCRNRGRFVASCTVEHFRTPRFASASPVRRRRVTCSSRAAGSSFPSLAIEPGLPASVISALARSAVLSILFSFPARPLERLRSLPATAITYPRKNDTPDDARRVTCQVCPPVRDESRVTLHRNLLGEAPGELDSPLMRKDEAGGAGDECTKEHGPEQAAEWTHEVRGRKRRRPSETSRTRQKRTQRKANPPSGHDAPEQSQDGGRMRRPCPTVKYSTDTLAVIWSWSTPWRIDAATLIATIRKKGMESLREPAPQGAASATYQPRERKARYDPERLSARGPDRPPGRRGTSGS
jgi:hypothetical protein